MWLARIDWNGTEGGFEAKKDHKRQRMVVNPVAITSTHFHRSIQLGKSVRLAVGASMSLSAGSFHSL